MATTDIVLDGSALPIASVTAVARHGARVRFDPVARARVDAARAAVLAQVALGKPIYGINTGFGNFAQVRVDDHKLADLQRNIVRSHAAGIGDPLPTEVVRGAMLLTAAVVYTVGMPRQQLPAADVAANLTMVQEILGFEHLDGSYWTLQVELFFYAQMVLWFALGLLRRIRAALSPGGRLLLAEPMAGTAGAEPMGDAYFGFYLLAMGRGRPRRPDEIQAMLGTAGFAQSRLLPTPTPLLTRVVIADAGGN